MKTETLLDITKNESNVALLSSAPDSQKLTCVPPDITHLHYTSDKSQRSALDWVVPAACVSLTLTTL